jgi:hypothetical protein
MASVQKKMVPDPVKVEPRPGSAPPIKTVEEKAPPVTPPDSIPDPKPVAAQPPATLGVTPPPPAPSKPMPVRVTVKTGKMVSLAGHITWLAPGTVITEESYGAGIVEKLRLCGVEFEPL